MADQQDRTPREDQVATEPATVERCAEDYAQGAGDRNAMAMHERHQAARR